MSYNGVTNILIIFENDLKEDVSKISKNIHGRYSCTVAKYFVSFTIIHHIERKVTSSSVHTTMKPRRETSSSFSTLLKIEYVCTHDRNSVRRLST